jgi:phospholipid/cholesterol/gamma-HCH transport system substrate-binding protein
LFDDGPGAAKEVNALLKSLRPVLPDFLLPLVEVNQVLDPRIPGLGQLLTTLPTVTKNAQIGVPGDGYGHITMQYNYNTPVCTEGYLPPAQWPSPLDTRDHPLFPADCTDPKAQRGYDGSNPLVQRGFNVLPLVDDHNPIYHARPYGRSTPVNPTWNSGGASGATASSTQSGLPSVLNQDGWEGMFTGGAGG